MSELEQIRHAVERGKILTTLVGEFGRPVLIGTLIGALDLQGYSFTRDGLAFHLAYLAAQGFIEMTRVRDLPTYRRDRQVGVDPDAVVKVGLLPRGLQLVDGNIPEDPQIRF